MPSVSDPLFDSSGNIVGLLNAKIVWMEDLTDGTWQPIKLPMIHKVHMGFHLQKAVL